MTHRPHARWHVSAGPFAVHVIGTRFDVQWNPEQDKFALDLKQGAVDVAGCAFEQGYHMHAGQRLEASCKDGRFDVVGCDERAAQRARLGDRRGHVAGSAGRRASADAGGARAGRSRARDVARAGAPQRARMPCAPRPRRVRRRRHRNRRPSSRRACARRAISRPSARAPDVEELAALADAAHYARDQEREAYAWRLLRRRFPGTSRAALAAFALGRLEFDVHGSYPKAAEWFGTYLKEQPGGSLVREARGRLMEATLRAGDTRGARALGAAYLRDYPAGPHADLARSLEQTPAP